jgi:thiamine kinase-like enzyme
MDIHQQNINYLSNLLATNKILEGDHFEITYFKSGGGTHLYLIQAGDRKYLARINFYSPKNDWAIREQEYKVLEFIESLNIAPKVYYLSTANELRQQFTIVDYIEGSPLDTILESHINSMAGTLKELHTFRRFDRSGDKLPPTDELPYTCSVYNEFADGEDKQIEKYDLPGIDDVAVVYNRIKADLGKWFNSLDIYTDCTNFCLCHADLKSENILDQDGKIFLIDWECAGVDIPETDIGRLFAGCQLNGVQQKIFMDRYYGKDKDAEVIERIMAVKHVLNFFRIIEDFILLKRKEWDANAMIAELKEFEKIFHNATDISLSKK